MNDFEITEAESIMAANVLKATYHIDVTRLTKKQMTHIIKLLSDAIHNPLIKEE